MGRCVFFTTLPKSGTGFTWNVLSEVLGVPVPERVREPAWSEDMNSGVEHFKDWAFGDFATQTLNPDRFNEWAARREMFGGHMPASWHNVQCLEDSVVDRMFLLMRDPRDATVSWVHHVAKAGEATRRHISRFCHLPKGYYGWDHARQLSFLVRTHLPQAVNWLEGWLEWLGSEERTVDVLPVYFDQLKRRPREYFQRLSEFYELEPDLSKMPQPKAGSLHYRKGSHGQWQEEFSRQDQALSRTLMGLRLERAYGIAARGLARRYGLDQALENNDQQAARKALIGLMRVVPNDAGLLEMVGEVFPGVEVPEIQGTAGLFLYREELVEQLQRYGEA